MPTVQAPFVVEANTGGGATVANPGSPAVEDRTVLNEPEVEDRTVLNEPEVLDPTVRAPQAGQPEGLTVMATVAEPVGVAPTGPAPAAFPEASPVTGGDYLETQAAAFPEASPVTGEDYIETQVVAEEQAEVTITSVNESPAKLIVSRNGQSREFLLRKPDITIGRAPSNDIALSGDQLASRRHALIHFDGVNYVIRDLVSANGTYINGVELRSPTPLSNGDHVGVGEHELIFFSTVEGGAETETMTFHKPDAVEANPETVPVPGQADTIEPGGAYVTHGGSVASGAWETAAVSPQDAEAEVQTAVEASMLETEQAGTSGGFAIVTYDEQMPPPVSPPEPEIPEATIIERIELTEESSASAVEEEVEEEEVIQVDMPIEERLRTTETVNEEDMPLPVPQLPEIPTILSAIQSLDSTTAEMRENLRRAKALEEEAAQLRDQLRAATEAISSHDNSVAVLAQRLRVGVADVSNRLNKVIEEVQRADESLSITDIMKLIDDVRTDPRDIYTLGSLARRARELAQFFELHQHVNQILSECLATLTELLSPDQAKPEGEA